MRLYYIRHGQSTNNALYIATKTSDGRNEDPELSEIGVQQARLLVDFIRAKDAGAEALKEDWKRDIFGFTHLYTSLMVRAVQTGTILSDGLGIPLVAWPEIHETGGIYLDDPETGESHGLPGKTRTYFQRHYPHLVLPESLTDAGWWNRPQESPEEWQSRPKKVLQTLFERHGGRDDRVAIVSHGGFYTILMREILDLRGENVWLTMVNTAITRLDFAPDGSVAFYYHNRSDHLPDQLVT